MTIVRRSMAPVSRETARNYTPGPWKVIFSRKNGAALRIEAPHDKGIPGAVGSVVRQNGIGLPACPIGKANARLIAHAPDLIEALRELVVHDEAMIRAGIMRPFGELERAQKAIRSATMTESGANPPKALS